MPKFINLSNHPSTKWSKKQLESVPGIATIVDIPFPQVDPHAHSHTIKSMAKQLVEEIVMEHDPAVVHVMGEMVLTYHLVTLFKEKGIMCVASTTERNTIENPDGTKTVRFDFVQFRMY